MSASFIVLDWANVAVEASGGNCRRRLELRTNTRMIELRTPLRR